MLIKYIIAEDGDDLAHPNAFVIPDKGGASYPTVKDISQKFPVPGIYHFRFLKAMGSNLNVWLDMTDETASVPLGEGGTVFVKASRVTRPSAGAGFSAPSSSSSPSSRTTNDGNIRQGSSSNTTTTTATAKALPSVSASVSVPPPQKFPKPVGTAPATDEGLLKFDSYDETDAPRASSSGTRAAPPARPNQGTSAPVATVATGAMFHLLF
jgi:hypothetical protein